MRIPILLAAVALVLCGCNANQPINPSGLAGRCANDAACNPYNPSSYAQNNTGIGRQNPGAGRSPSGIWLSWR